MTDSAETMRKADRTRIFFDTEFIEDGKTIDLISIGMVRDDGETYYAESSDCDLSRADQWVKDNVLIHLRGGSAIKSRRQIAADIIAFAGPSPEFWAYYADYDWVVLCQLYGRMIDLPNGWPMFCRDLKQLAGDTVLPQQISTEHHALADAKWAAEAFAALSASGTKSDGGTDGRASEAMGLAKAALSQDLNAPSETADGAGTSRAGIKPGPSDPIPSQPDERERVKQVIELAMIEEAEIQYADFTDRDRQREKIIANAADAILAMQAERRGAEPRGCPTPGACSCPPAPIAGLEPVASLLDELREYTALRYAGDCKCGNCQLVPRATLDRAIQTMAQLEAHAAEQVRAEREACAKIAEGMPHMLPMGEKHMRGLKGIDVAAAIRARGQV